MRPGSTGREHLPVPPGDSPVPEHAVPTIGVLLAVISRGCRGLAGCCNNVEQLDLRAAGGDVCETRDHSVDALYGP
jgi:hypothetical protein